MKRGLTGRYRNTITAGERVQAFIPNALPPIPEIVLDGKRQQLLERATLALGRLDSVGAVLPATEQLLYSYVRQEAVLSSQIEGTRSTLSDLLLFELEQAPGTPIDDVLEVSSYVAALHHGIARLNDGFPLTGRLICEMHAILMEKGRGRNKLPGMFRRSQNWIGGTRPGNAHFVPPPPDEIAECMSDLEKFINDSDGLPILLRAAAAHVQFETIHPFLDGNGRIGRLLITLLFVNHGVLKHPLLYLSLFLKQHRQTYYRLLDTVRIDGDWEEWIDFFLEGIEQTATTASITAQKLVQLFNDDADVIQKGGRSATSALRVHTIMCQRPIITIRYLCEHHGMTFPTASKAVDTLVALGILQELTGQRRNRVFVYQTYLDVLGPGNEVHA
ncbi:MAG: Fic family protein [Candidatus Kapabacteria bacterium]|nr:Fic family protein [Candidatus Kapabacteria bacterium]